MFLNNQQYDFDDVNTISWTYDKYVPDEDEYTSQEEYDELVSSESIFKLECSNENKGIRFYIDVNKEELDELFDNDIPDTILRDVSNGKTRGYISDILMSDSHIDPNDVSSINNFVKKFYDIADDYYPGFRGYILTDGTLVSFGDYIDHVNIGVIDNMTVGKFVSLGNIRVGKDSLYLEKEPTNQQERAMREMISYLSDSDLYVDITKYDGEGTYSDSICSKHYINPSPARVIGEIRQYFREGIKLLESVNKESQLQIILSTNPMHDDIHYGVRSVNDIKEYKETLSKKDDIITTPDYTMRDIENTLKSGKVIVYSSHPIKPGTFVTTSLSIASDYAGSKPYSKFVDLTEVAWLDSIEGQYTGNIINEEYNSIISEEISSADEIIKNGKLNFHSFEPKDKLCDDIFDSNDKMKDSFRKKLVSVIKNVFDDVDIIEDYMVKDVVLIGSLASYHYSSYSDIDLHFIVDMSMVNDDKDAAVDILNDIRKTWNKRNNIEIDGYSVEIYFNDISDENVTNGIYSIVDNEWIKYPDKEDYVIDKHKLETKAIDYINKIDSLHKGDPRAEELWNKIKKKRKTGLSEIGEFSDDNILFKILRRTGYLGKLKNKKPKKANEVVMADDLIN